MAHWVKLVLLALLLNSCSFFEEDDVPVTVNLSASKETYEQGKSTVAITATITGTGSKKIFWKLDSKEYTEGSETKEFGPGELVNLSHVVTCSVSVGGKSAVASQQLKSTAFNSKSPVERYGRLQVIGKNLCDQNGATVQLRGMSTHGMQYHPQFINENSVKALANDWKADIIRVSCYVNEGPWNPKGTYLDNPAHWRSEIYKMVRWAKKYGIYVLIDWHMLTPGDPNVYVDDAKVFWKEMMDSCGTEQHVLFDICNEPNNVESYTYTNGDYVSKNLPYSVDWNVIKKYADQIMPIIRAKSQNVAIVGTPAWASNPAVVIGKTLSYTNLMYTMHFYAAEHGESYRSSVQEALDAGIPVFVTEFGTQRASGDGENDFEASQVWMDFMNKNMLSWCNWNFSDDERSGAVFDETKFDINNASHYSDTTKMKPAGKWIFNHIRNR